MGIIGIVSALTLPNLNSSTGEKEKVAKLKKIYQNLNDAVGRSAAVYGPVDEITNNWTDDSLTKIGDRLTEFMKVSKNCGTSTNQGCFANGQDLYHYNDANKGLNNKFDSESGAYKFVLADGTSIAIVPFNALYVFVNLDGPTKRPVSRRNTFVFFYDYDGTNWKDDLVTVPATEDLTDDELLKACTQTDSSGVGCASWVIRNENLDYLKADTDGKCPNGKVLNYTTNTTCK